MFNLQNIIQLQIFIIIITITIIIIIFMILLALSKPLLWFVLTFSFARISLVRHQLRRSLNFADF